MLSIKFTLSGFSPSFFLIAITIKKAIARRQTQHLTYGLPQ
ncbi:hypothetical protein ACP6PL_15795 [Dapis sp. BLCC M126]